MAVSQGTQSAATGIDRSVHRCPSPACLRPRRAVCPAPSDRRAHSRLSPARRADVHNSAPNGTQLGRFGSLCRPKPAGCVRSNVKLCPDTRSPCLERSNTHARCGAQPNTSPESWRQDRRSPIERTVTSGRPSAADKGPRSSGSLVRTWSPRSRATTTTLASTMSVVRVRARRLPATRACASVSGLTSQPERSRESCA